MDNSERLEFINQVLSEITPQEQGNSVASLNSEQPDEEILDLGDSFDFDGFQVVRREFFAHTNESTEYLRPH